MILAYVAGWTRWSCKVSSRYKTPSLLWSLSPLGEHGLASLATGGSYFLSNAKASYLFSSCTATGSEEEWCPFKLPYLLAYSLVLCPWLLASLACPLREGWPPCSYCAQLSQRLGLTAESSPLYILPNNLAKWLPNWSYITMSNPGRLSHSPALTNPLPR